MRPIPICLKLVKVKDLSLFRKVIALMGIEVSPGISAIEYAKRRTKLAAQLPDNAIAVVTASDIVYRTGHVFYDFHQDPDFFYLTGASKTIQETDVRLKHIAQDSMNLRHWL